MINMSTLHFSSKIVLMKSNTIKSSMLERKENKKKSIEVVMFWGSFKQLWLFNIWSNHNENL